VKITKLLSLEDHRIQEGVRLPKVGLPEVRLREAGREGWEEKESKRETARHAEIVRDSDILIPASIMCPNGGGVLK